MDMPTLGRLIKNIVQYRASADAIDKEIKLRYGDLSAVQNSIEENKKALITALGPGKFVFNYGTQIGSRLFIKGILVHIQEKEGDASVTTEEITIYSETYIPLDRLRISRTYNSRLSHRLFNVPEYLIQYLNMIEQQVLTSISPEDLKHDKEFRLALEKVYDALQDIK